jgi:hypothetical protein
MPTLYCAELYVNLNDNNFEDIVNGTLKSLLDLKCTFNGISIGYSTIESGDPEKIRFWSERHIVTIEKVKRIIKEITINFWCFDENEIAVDMTPWEEYVLIYGNKEPHYRNKCRILSIVESVYKNTKAYFGWMDGEMNSGDYSYDILTGNKSTTGNEFVIVGKSFINKVNISLFEENGYHHKFLNDGGLVIEHPRGRGSRYIL